MVERSGTGGAVVATAAVPDWLPEVLDLMDCGVLVLDPASEVVVANCRARAMAGNAPLRDLETSAAFVVDRRPLTSGSGLDVVVIRPRGSPAERLQAIEALILEMRALSHAINNPVTALLGRAQMLSARNHDDPHVAKSAVVLEESASRVADLARSLSALLRKATQAAAG